MEGQIIRTEYSEVMQKSYIDYAMSVIVSRALPDVRDGLKPVQRRTLDDIYPWYHLRYGRIFDKACHSGYPVHTYHTGFFFVPVSIRHEHPAMLLTR